jgi:hypothetical protein
LIAVYGFLVTTIDWKYAFWMWTYAHAWLLFNNVAKIEAYRLMRSREAIV